MIRDRLRLVSGLTVILVAAIIIGWAGIRYFRQPNQPASISTKSNQPSDFAKQNTVTNYFASKRKFNKDLSTLGVDTNHDGTWDDLEAFIRGSSKTAAQKKALTYSVQNYQKILARPELGSLMKNGQVPHFLMRSLACEIKVWGGADHVLSSHKFFDEILTTKARKIAYLKFLKELKGAIIHSWMEERDGNPCPFDTH